MKKLTFSLMLGASAFVASTSFAAGSDLSVARLLNTVKNGMENQQSQPEFNQTILQMLRSAAHGQAATLASPSKDQCVTESENLEANTNMYAGDVNKCTTGSSDCPYVADGVNLMKYSTWAGTAISSANLIASSGLCVEDASIGYTAAVLMNTELKIVNEWISKSSANTAAMVIKPAN